MLRPLESLGRHAPVSHAGLTPSAGAAARLLSERMCLERDELSLPEPNSACAQRVPSCPQLPPHRPYDMP